MKLLRLLTISFLVLSCTGCIHKRQGYAQANTYYRSMMSSVLSDPAWYNKYYNETDPQKKMELRNRLIGYCVWLVDEDFNRYATKFSHNQAVGSLIADWTSLAASGASTVASPAALYGAISTGIQGAHAAYDRDALDQQSRAAILLKMSALREEQLAVIYRSELLPDNQYPLIQGLIDVQHYIDAGTVHAALASISQDAAIQRQNSKEVLRTLRK
jgi:hypothetical protein